jgi:hypothetical protein
MDPSNRVQSPRRVEEGQSARLTGVVSNALSALRLACWDSPGKATPYRIPASGLHRDWAANLHHFRLSFISTISWSKYANKFVSEGHTRLKMVVANDKVGCVRTPPAFGRSAKQWDPTSI